jgi:hypothetical protein
MRRARGGRDIGPLAPARWDRESRTARAIGNGQVPQRARFWRIDFFRKIRFGHDFEAVESD